MPDHYYGYTAPSLPADIARYDDYVTTPVTSDYEPTHWDDFNRTNIDSMWAWIRHESDERATAVADMWRRVGTLLDTTATHLRRYADTLAAKWHSEAAKSFLAEVGKTLYSLDEWRQVAATNAAGLAVVADSIRKNQQAVKPIYLNYVNAINNPGSVSGSDTKSSWDWWTLSYVDESEDDRKKRLRQEYTDKVKPYVRDLADTYLDVYFYHLTRGKVFKGPRDSVFPTPPTPPRGQLPGGGLPSPVLPTLPNQPRPTLPAQPALPALPTAHLPDPELSTVGPHALTLAALVASLPHLPVPQLPDLPMPPGTAVPQMPVVPPLPRVPPPPLEGVRPTGEPGPARPAMPAVPARPNLSGVRRPGDQVRPPAPARGMPNLHGAKGRGTGSGAAAGGPDLSEEVEHPNARGPVTPRLSGRRQGGPGGVEGGEEPPVRGAGPRGRAGTDDPADHLAGRRRPGVPEQEQEAFRERPVGRPDLAGRAGNRRAGTPAEPRAGTPAEPRAGTPVEPAEAGHPPVLGRRSAEPRKAQETVEDEYKIVAEPGGEDELWTVDQSVPTVIDTPQVPPPVDPGPAIGRAG